MKLQVDFYNKGQQALKDGASLADIRSMDVISLLLKARMDVKDDEMDKLDKIETQMVEQFKSITGVTVKNWPLKAESNTAKLLKLKDHL